MQSENGANVPFLYPLKTLENHVFFDYFRGYGKRPLTQKWASNLLAFQKLNLHPSKDWSVLKVLSTSDKVCS